MWFAEQDEEAQMKSSTLVVSLPSPLAQMYSSSFLLVSLCGKTKAVDGLRAVAGQCPTSWAQGAVSSCCCPTLLSAVAQTRALGLALIYASFLPPAHRMKN